MHVLAIDQGTSATKAIVIGAGARVLGEGSASVSVEAGPGGAVEQDPGTLLESVLAAGRAAVADAGVPIDAVGLGNQGETVLCWDRASGRPLGPALSWQDRRAVTVTDRLRPHADELVAVTGLPLDPYFAGPKMAWLRAHAGPEGVVTTVDAWITHRLTGAFVTDAATASRTLLLDLDRVDWSEAACRLFELEADDQPEVVACDAVVGETAAFGQAAPVSGLVVDQQGALFGQSCFASGDAKCTYGTGAFLLANAGARAPRSRSGLAICVGWKLGEETTFCADGQVYTAGAALAWLERLGLLQDAAALDAACAGADEDPEGPVFVPSLAGLGAPFWAPRARGGWTGLGLDSGRAELVAAVVRGIAAQVATLADALAADLGRPLGRLRVDGGLTRSAALMQAQADLLQAPVELASSADATALGVGALARLGAGAAASPAEAVGSWSPEAVFEPRMSADEAQHHLARFRLAADALVGLSRATS
ncbi:MAG: FGGY family carbohydrate kinase [Nocardioidaceae bacterium]